MHFYRLMHCFKSIHDHQNKFLVLHANQLNWFSNVHKISMRKISKSSLQTPVLLIYGPCSSTWCACFIFLVLFTVIFISLGLLNRVFFTSKVDQNLSVFQKYISRWSFWHIQFIFWTFLRLIFIHFESLYFFVKVFIWLNRILCNLVSFNFNYLN